MSRAAETFSAVVVRRLLLRKGERNGRPTLARSLVVAVAVPWLFACEGPSDDGLALAEDGAPCETASDCVEFAQCSPAECDGPSICRPSSGCSAAGTNDVVCACDGTIALPCHSSSQGEPAHRADYGQTREYPGIAGKPCDPALSFPVDLTVTLTDMDGYEGALVVISGFELHSVVITAGAASARLSDAFHFTGTTDVWRLWVDADGNCEASAGDLATRIYPDVDFIGGLASIAISGPEELLSLPSIAVTEREFCERRRLNEDGGGAGATTLDGGLIGQ